MSDWGCEGLFLSISVARPSQVSFGKSLEGKSTMNSVEEIGAPVQYEFRVNHLLLYFLKLHNKDFVYIWSKKSNQAVSVSYFGR